MKEQDLRIGNLVMTDNTTYHFTDIEEVDLTVLGEVADGSSFYSPLPISEELFNNFMGDDFEFIGFGTRVIYMHKKYKAIKYELCAGDEVGVYFQDNLIRFEKFVHSWQNIHFSFTEQELARQ